MLKQESVVPLKIVVLFNKSVHSSSAYVLTISSPSSAHNVPAYQRCMKEQTHQPNPHHTPTQVTYHNCSCSTMMHPSGCSARCGTPLQPSPPRPCSLDR